MAVQETSPPWQQICKDDDPSMCVNILPGGSGPTAPPEPVSPCSGLSHHCLYHPRQAVIQGQNVDPGAFGLVQALPEDLFLTGPTGEDIEQAQAVLTFLEQNDVRIYNLSSPEDDLFRVLNEIHGAGAPASPHYLLRPAPYWGWGPHSLVKRLDPQWTWGDLDQTGPEGAAEGARLVIMDTGANGDLLAEIDVNGVDAEATIDPRGIGHGTFAAAVAKKYNPGLNVELYRASWPDGTLSEVSVTAAFQRAQPVEDVVSLSLGTYPCGPEYPPLVLEIGLAGQVVAASGNDGINHVPEQLYPASRQDVIGVSAYDKDWGYATWANPGEVYAPGEDVVSYYHDGTTGSLAVWSGTSFATPHYAACLASGVCSPPM